MSANADLDALSHNIASSYNLQGIRNITQQFINLISRSFRILLGRSYYHVPQTVGKHISPNLISGYYNDLRMKADWKGKSDGDGVPTVTLSNGHTVYFPIHVAQMALGTYDLWLEKSDAEQQRTFLRLAGWLNQNINENGGWKNPWEFLRPTSLSNYSAMAQGEAISVLIRAYRITKDKSFMESSEKAYQFLISPVGEGGCTYYIDKQIYLEEYPEYPRSTVLNGYIFALFGVYDFMLVTGGEDVKRFFFDCSTTLEKNLHLYDTGFWTYYDQLGTISSPFYHSLHISLLDALYLITGRESFNSVSRKWSLYQKNPLYKLRAIAAKVIQKLNNPANVTVKI